MLERLGVLLAVAGGGAAGALVRYALSGWLVKRFPMGTLAVNLAGCLLIGLLVGAMHHRDWLSPVARHFLIMGFLGSLTTFSTFGYQSVQLYMDGDVRLAALNVLTNVCIGFAAVAAGLWLGGRLVTAVGL